jgi:sugar lactone lactonase YvrE
VLGWSDAATFQNGAVADLVIGQPDLTSTSCNNGGVSATTLCMPRSVAVDSAGNLYVADTANSRVLEYDSPFTLDRAADRVFGQDGSFTMASCNGGGTASTLTLCKPFGVGVDTSGNLYVADSRNNRVLEYDSPLSTDARPIRSTVRPKILRRQSATSAVWLRPKRFVVHGGSLQTPGGTCT